MEVGVCLHSNYRQNAVELVSVLNGELAGRQHINAVVFNGRLVTDAQCETRLVSFANSFGVERSAFVGVRGLDVQ
jgi:hypothetical protein